MQIWFDMDGVLADFDKFADTIIKNRGSGKFFHELTEAEKENRKKLWKHLIEIEGDFWLKLDLIEGMKEVVYYLKDNHNLHSLGIISHAPCFTGQEDYYEKVVIHKKEWIKKHFPDTFEKVNVIIPEKEKYEFMIGQPKDNILIDDVEHNIIGWKKQGGIGIIYKNYNQVLTDIKGILKENE